MSFVELYTKGTRVWIADEEEVWQAAVLGEDFNGQKKIKVVTEDDQEKSIAVSKDNLPPLRNPDILIGQNDLTSLSYLHEPAVLHNLRVRFEDRNNIYTYCGIVLVAINPYQHLPIYDNDTIHAYSGQLMHHLDPHVFAVAEEAYKRLNNFAENQSIIVSGESGAGKTVSAKCAMRYLATVCGAEAETQVEKRVLASNPIMEAFGNAKTTRNDNSSRFGKYIQICFGAHNSISSANMRTYLLEKSRVVHQSEDERNYHIFYQLCSNAGDPNFANLKLDNAESFMYLGQGGSCRVTSIDDLDDFLSLREAFSLMGINEVRQMDIFGILSAVLHIGNVKIASFGRRAETCHVDAGDESAKVMCQLLGINADQMRFWLCHRKIVTANEALTKPLTLLQAINIRDALSKHIYSQLFHWIVSEVNKQLSGNQSILSFIGVLDIYGFETFEVNSFEQFCINYANEKLQQQFCRHVFKLEQEEYVKEEIGWSFIDFHDNQVCIDLIEGKLGILDLLDEECRMPNATDKNWCMKLLDKHCSNKHFTKPRTSQTSFIVVHFADQVEYEIEGFTEKNRDTVLQEHIDILKASQFELVAELFEDSLATSPLKNKKTGLKGLVRGASSSSRQMKKTVGAQFRDSLKLLMQTLFSTTPHYVRCIKPNDEKKPFCFDAHRASQQLRACGVLETIRISAAGYPSRWTYTDFFKRYRVLMHSKKINRRDVKSTCQSVLTTFIKDKEKYQTGKTKIFFRAGQVAYLEKLRTDKLCACGVLIQKRVRGHLARVSFRKVKRTTLLLQQYGRAVLARKHAQQLRMRKAATLIQASWRGHRQRTSYRKTIKTIISLQVYSRAFLSRLHYVGMMKEHRVIQVQRMVRGWVARQRFLKVLRGIVKLQSLVRRAAAKKELKRLKVEAKSVEFMKNAAKGLENKIIQIQQKLNLKNKEMQKLQEDNTLLAETRVELHKVKTELSGSKEEAGRVEGLEELVEKLKLELEEEKGKNAVLVADSEGVKKDRKKTEAILKADNVELTKKLKEAEEVKMKEEEGHQATLTTHLKQLREELTGEFEDERVHHQRMVKEYQRLQQRYDNLHGDLQCLTSPPPLSQPFKFDGVQQTPEAMPTAATQATATPTPPPPTPQASDDGDVGLIPRLQGRVRQLEWEKSVMRREMGKKRRESVDVVSEAEAPGSQVYDSMKLQELEIENTTLRNDLESLQAAVLEDKAGAGDQSGKHILGQLEVMGMELSRRREECIQLRTVLASMTRHSFKSPEEQKHNETSMEYVNEDGELEMAYKTQKDLNKLLETELQRMQSHHMKEERQLRRQLEDIKKDNVRQHKLVQQLNEITSNLSLTPKLKMEATMQYEITRLTSENLDLREHMDTQQEQVQKLKKALKLYVHKLKVTGAADDSSEMGEELCREVVVEHAGREFRGMVEYRREDEGLVVRSLIIDLKPRMAYQHLPGLPAFLIFMAVRHTDYVNDDDKVRSLLTATINAIKKTVKRSQEDSETLSLWLANTCRLLHHLKQYSGEKAFQTHNTAKQNDHCLRNFDLSEYRQILSDLAVWIFQGLIKLTEAHVHPLIVGSILEHEAIAGLTTGKPASRRYARPSATTASDESLDQLISALDSLMKMLTLHAVGVELTQQIFRQIFYFICANSLNNLLLRKDMCHWTKGMQMRYNLSHMEQWLRDNRLNDTNVQTALEPIVQASQLLQARKTDSDVDSVCDMCSKLTTSQIIKILNLYTPLNDFEERVPISFIRKIQERLSCRQDSTQTLLMDCKYLFAITFPFTPSPVALESIAPPPEWKLSFLKRI